MNVQQGTLQVKLQLAEAQRRALGANLASPPQKVALIMDGRALSILLERKYKQKLLALGVQCAAVICCRVSPLQKSQITRWDAVGCGLLLAPLKNNTLVKDVRS